MYAGPQPLAALLGVRSGGKVAVFLLSSATSAIGEGSCRPSRLDCQTIEMRVGQAEFLDVPGSPGQSYELKLTRLSVKRTATKAQARAFRRRRAKTGAAMLQQAVADGQTYATRYAYDSAHGVLTLRSAAAAAASAPQGSSQTPVQAGPAASTGSPTGQ
jgi:hypothetical protein